MEEQVNKLVDKVWNKLQSLSASHRYLIAVAGIPGSGKTTLAATVAATLNERQASTHPALAAGGNKSLLAAFIPMDGYHLTRAQLSALPDPNTAHARRGASFTFDSNAYLELIRSVRAPLTPESRTIYAPSFDHKIKDPVEDDIAISPAVRVLVFEGNYVALADKGGPWQEAAELMDEVWFVEVDEEAAAKRLIKRHVEAGIAADEGEAERRVRENDLVNGTEITQNKVKCHEVITSIEDSSWDLTAQTSNSEDAENGSY